MINFNCDKCGRPFSLPEHLAKRKIKCPGCNTIISAPEVENESEINNQETLHKYIPTSLIHGTHDGFVMFRCNYCDNEYKVAMHNTGKALKCNVCNHDLTADISKPKSNAFENDSISVKCAMCGASVIVSNSIRGQLTRCPQCGCDVEVRDENTHSPSLRRNDFNVEQLSTIPHRTLDEMLNKSDESNCQCGESGSLASGSDDYHQLSRKCIMPSYPKKGTVPKAMSSSVDIISNIKWIVGILGIVIVVTMIAVKGPGWYRSITNNYRSWKASRYTPMTYNQYRMDKNDPMYKYVFPDKTTLTANTNKVKESTESKTGSTTERVTSKVTSERNVTKTIQQVTQPKLQVDSKRADWGGLDDPSLVIRQYGLSGLDAAVLEYAIYDYNAEAAKRIYSSSSQLYDALIEKASIEGTGANAEVLKAQRDALQWNDIVVLMLKEYVRCLKNLPTNADPAIKVEWNNAVIRVRANTSIPKKYRDRTKGVQ